MHVTTRKEWGARSPKPMTDGNHPREAFIHHSDDPDGDIYTDAAKRHAKMRAIQNFHMDTRGWSDIAYHYVVFQVHDGIFEARRARYIPAAQMSHNTNTLAICVIGNGDHEPMKRHTRFLIEQIIEQYPGIKTVGGHRDVVATDCPGDLFYRALPQIADATDRKLYRPSH